MVIQNNTSSQNTLRNMWVNKKDEEDSQQKLASGRKINKAADDAAGLAISEELLAQIAIASAAQQNTTSSTSLVQTAEGAMSEVSNMLTRASELAVQASNGTYSDTQRSALQSEYDAIMGEVNRVASASNFNGQSLLDGSLDASLQIGTDSADYSQIDVSTSGLSGVVSDLTGLSLSDSNALDAIKSAIDTVSTERASLGAVQNRLSYSANSLAEYQKNLTAAESRIRDTDMAEEISKKKQKNVLFQANMAMMAESNNSKQGVLNLLK